MNTILNKKTENFSNINFDLGKGPWINSAGESGYIGEISSVVYIDISEEIEKEEYTKDTNMKH